jgi:hypothetical protein
MSGRFHPHYFAKDFNRKVTKAGKCQLDAPVNQYLPLFNTVDFPSHGFRTMFGSWIVKRVMHPVSTPEYEAILMFHAPRRGVANLAEQYALDPAHTREIAFELGVKHPAIRGADIIMSTDLVVTFVRDGGILNRRAFAIKRESDITSRVIEKLAIEQGYWAKRGITWSLLLDVNLPRQLIANMELLIEYASEKRLDCDVDAVPEVAAWIVPHLASGAPLRTVCLRCDTALRLPRGTSLSVAYHLTVNGQLRLDIEGAYLPNCLPQADEEAA